MSNRKIAGVGAAIGMLLLILDGKTALAGAQSGVELCIRTVIPALFPFFVISPILIGSIKADFLRPLARLCGMPRGTEGLLLTAFLGGYPTGAQAVSQAKNSGQLTLWQARRLMAFCNNAGPSFLFGMIAPVFGSPWIVWLLWSIHIFSALAVAVLLPREDVSTGDIRLPEVTLPQSLRKAVQTMGLVCGWVVLFRIVISILERWLLWLFPKEVQVLLIGLLELSNGCCALGEIGNTGLRFLICSGMLAFGGLCVTMQTLSVAGKEVLGMYLPGKFLQTLISLIMAYFVQLRFADAVVIPVSIGMIVASCGAFLYLLLRKPENSCSNPGLLGV